MHIVQEYSSYAGTVYLFQGRKYFVVRVETVVAPGIYRIKEMGRLSYEEALDKYIVAKSVLDGVQYTSARCKYRASRTRPCNSKNCPKKFGGAAYWEIFGNSCLHKVK